MAQDLDSFSFEESARPQGSSDDEDDVPEVLQKVVKPKKKIVAMPELKYGRDKNGLYNNHKHFVHLRNKINSLE